MIKFIRTAGIWGSECVDKVFNATTTSLRLGALRVIMYHGFYERDIDKLEKQVLALSRDWDFIDPGKIDQGVYGRKGRSILLTFDDGFQSQYLFARRVLNSLGIRAIFFLTTDFSGLSGHSNNARSFLSSRFRLSANQFTMNEFSPIGWDEAMELVDAGHVIGCHTKSHPSLGPNYPSQNLKDEICGAADIIENRLGRPVEHFAFPFGGVNDLSPDSCRIAHRRFKYVYSGVRGVNWGISAGHLIFRDALTPATTITELSAGLSGHLDWYSRGRRKRQLNIWDHAIR